MILHFCSSIRSPQRSQMWTHSVAARLIVAGFAASVMRPTLNPKGCVRQFRNASGLPAEAVH